MNIDLQAYYRKLADNEPISEDEMVALLKATAHFRAAAVYFADCHAATGEGLPKSTSKSQRTRFMNICQIAASVLRGDIAAIRFPSHNVEHVAKRCDTAVERLQSEQPNK
jgi:hypothetical protein